MRKLNSLDKQYEAAIAPDRKSQRHDYLDQIATLRAIEDIRPDCPVMCTAKVGGILDNVQRRLIS